MGVFTSVLRRTVWHCVPLGVIACGAGHNSSDNSATGGHSGLDASDAASYSITILDFSYVPANLDVPAGANVDVINDDGEPHSVTSEANLDDFTFGAVQGAQFDTGPVGPNERAAFTVLSTAAAGTVIPYYCSIHKGTMMQGTIIIR